MKIQTNNAIAVIVIVILLLGCSRYWKEGPYEVYWIDGNTTLGYNVGNGGYIGRVKEPVYIESNNKYISVYGCHTVCSYYYIDKTQDHKYADSDEFVYGPFTEKEFNLIINKLELPKITHE